MITTRRRMMAVAVLVCGFAVGMAGLLNYFKYRSTSNRLVKERMLVTGRSIEGGIQSALSLGMQFGDIGTLPATLERERATDDLIQSIDIFDASGKLLYSTDRLRNGRPVPASWVETARKAGSEDWFVDDGDDSAAGMAIENNFGVGVGQVALRYSRERLAQEEYAVARQIALSSLVVFVLASALSSAALLAVMRRLGRDVSLVEAAMRGGDGSRATAQALRGPFGGALRRFIDTTRRAEREVVDLRARLQRSPE